MAESVVMSTVISEFMKGHLGPSEMVYGGIVSMLIMLYGAAGYVIVKSVAAAVHFSEGYFYTYSGKSDFSDNLGYYELFILGGWIFWGLFQTTVGTYIATEAWAATDARVTEATNNGAIEDLYPVSWILAVKSVTLMMLVGVIHATIAYYLGTTADELVGWFDKYSDKTGNEGSDNDTGKVDVDGTSAQEDIQNHLITAVYGMFVGGIINFSSYIFYYEFINLNGDDGFTCDATDKQGVLDSRFTNAFAFLSAITDRDSCNENMPKFYAAILDTDDDGVFSRCENAQWLYNLQPADTKPDAAQAFALKYSSANSVAGISAYVCNQKYVY